MEWWIHWDRLWLIAVRRRRRSVVLGIGEFGGGNLERGGRNGVVGGCGGHFGESLCD